MKKALNTLENKLFSKSDWEKIRKQNSDFTTIILGLDTLLQQTHNTALSKRSNPSPPPPSLSTFQNLLSSLPTLFHSTLPSKTPKFYIISNKNLQTWLHYAPPNFSKNTPTLFPTNSTHKIHNSDSKLDFNLWSIEYVIALYLKEHFPEIKRIYVVGEQSFCLNIEKLACVKCCGGEDAGKVMEAYDRKCVLCEEDVDAVLVSMDYRSAFYQMAKTGFYVQRNKLFFASEAGEESNVLRCKEKEGWLPDFKPMLKAFETSAMKKATVIGKPNEYAFSKILQIEGVSVKNALVLGDSEENDLIPAKKLGIQYCQIHI